MYGAPSSEYSNKSRCAVEFMKNSAKLLDVDSGGVDSNAGTPGAASHSNHCTLPLSRGAVNSDDSAHPEGRRARTSSVCHAPTVALITSTKPS
jgi:hypothetical protein